MSAQPAPTPRGDDPSRCPQCDAPVAAADVRCATCGYALAGVAGRPGPYGRGAAVIAAAVLVLVYACALVVVLLSR